MLIQTVHYGHIRKYGLATKGYSYVVYQIKAYIQIKNVDIFIWISMHSNIAKKYFLNFLKKKNENKQKNEKNVRFPRIFFKYKGKKVNFYPAL